MVFVSPNTPETPQCPQTRVSALTESLIIKAENDPLIERRNHRFVEAGVARSQQVFINT